MHRDAVGIAGSCLDALRRWAPFSERYWHAMPGRPELGCFGTGYNGWGVQTNQKYLAAMAVLATSGPAPDDCGFPRARALDRALKALRFALASHASGDDRCTDGEQWGRTWISGLGIERMMHGVDRVEPHLTDGDRAGLRRVFADEADWLCTDYRRGPRRGVKGGIWAHDGHNDPESNIWNGAICARAALRYPDDPRADRWMERAHLFFVNGISVATDGVDETLLAGRRVRDRHRGPNFFPHYALDHHGYLNVGYMVICLSNIAMLHYGCVLRGQSPPDTLYHHARDLWGLVRRLFFADGRLLRVGGDSRIRYCYCQDYVIPALVFAADAWRDPHALDLLRGAVTLVGREQALSADGRFLSSRLDAMARQAPWYWTRLESDRAVVLSQAVDWLEQRAPAVPAAAEDYEDSVAGGWEEPEHGAVFHRSRTRFASWCWRASQPPQGLCLPPSEGDLAEWDENLAGHVYGLGRATRNQVGRHAQAVFPGGFLTTGEFEARCAPAIAEGWHDETVARHQLAYAALPDGHTVVRLEYAVTEPRRTYLGGWEGVRLEVPNDVFNGNTRAYYSAAGLLRLAGHLGARRVTDLESAWVNVEDRIGVVGVYGADTWSIVQRGRRIGGTAVGNILTDTLCFPSRSGSCEVSGATVVLDTGCLLLASLDAGATRRIAEEHRAARLACVDERGTPAPEARAVLVRGRDGGQYLLVANFGGAPARLRVDAPAGPWREPACGAAPLPDGALAIDVPAGGARLLVRAGRGP